MASTVVDRPIISADSHITEPPDCYTKHIDPKFRDQAPRVERDPQRGDMFVIPGMKPISMSLTAAAGIPPEDLAEAVQDLVRSLMLIADVSRPRPTRPAPPRGRRPAQKRR